MNLRTYNLQHIALTADTYIGMLLTAAVIYAFAAGLYYNWLTKHAEPAGHASFLYAVEAETPKLPKAA